MFLSVTTENYILRIQNCTKHRKERRQREQLWNEAVYKRECERGNGDIHDKQMYHQAKKHPGRHERQWEVVKVMRK